MTSSTIAGVLGSVDSTRPVGHGTSILSGALLMEMYRNGGLKVRGDFNLCK